MGEIRTQIKIDKIVVCGFSAIENRIELNLDKYTNLFDGPAKDVMLSIPLAIDFILNPSYENEQLALYCRNEKIPDIPEKKDASYVTLHISGDKPFELNGKKDRRFVVTRYVHKRSIGFVYYMLNGRKWRNQAIETFHNHLAQVQFIRINDPIIDECSRPTGCDLNKLYVDANHSNGTLEIIKTNHHLVNQSVAQDMMIFENKQMNEAKGYLIELRTLEAAKMITELEKYRGNQASEGHAAKAEQREIKLMLQADKYETIQRNRFDAYSDALRMARNAHLHSEPTDLTDFNAIFEEFLAIWEKYTEDKRNARMIKWQVEKYMEMMRINVYLAGYMNHPTITKAEFANDCSINIEAAKKRLQSLYLNDGYMQNKQMVNEKGKEIKISRLAVNNKVEKLKQVEQQLLDGKIETLQNSFEFLLCTNKMAAAQMTIEEFFEHQMVLHPMSIASWRTGFMALTSQSSYDQKIPDKFVGNIFDFINPSADGILLKNVLPMLAQYFALFMFTTKAAANAFTDIVKPFLKYDYQIYTYAFDESAPERVLPYESLAKQILTANTCAKYPHVVTWFNNIRTTMYTLPHKKLRNIAIKNCCKIISKAQCYHEDGTFSEVFNGKTVNEMKDFLEKWQNVAMQRDIKIKEQNEKFIMDKKIVAKKQSINELENRHFDIKITITELMNEIALGMKNLVEMTDLYDDYANLEMEQKIEIEVCEWKKDLLAAGKSNPFFEHKQMPEIPMVKVIPIIDAVRKFENCALNISQNINEHACSLPSDVIEKFKHNIDILQIHLTQATHFDYTQQFGTMKVEADELKKVCSDVDRKVMDYNMYLENYRIAMRKFSQLNMYPELMSLPEAKNLAKSENFQSLCEMERNCLDRVPNSLLLPDPYDDFNYFQARHTKLTEYIDDLVASEVDFTMINHEIELLVCYFDGLIDILKVLNASVDVGNQVIGFEVDLFDPHHFYIFPDTQIDAQEWFEWITLKQLCDIGTGLSFVSKTIGNNEILDMTTSDILDMNSGFLFHLALTVSMNPSLIILNNTIIGQPVDNLRNVLERFQVLTELERRSEQKCKSRQLIVVNRSSSSYDGLFKQGHQRHICELEQGKASIISQMHHQQSMQQ